MHNSNDQNNDFTITNMHMANVNTDVKNDIIIIDKNINDYNINMKNNDVNINNCDIDMNNTIDIDMNNTIDIDMNNTIDIDIDMNNTIDIDIDMIINNDNNKDINIDMIINNDNNKDIDMKINAIKENNDILNNDVIMDNIDSIIYDLKTNIEINDKYLDNIDNIKNINKSINNTDTKMEYNNIQQKYQDQFLTLLDKRVTDMIDDREYITSVYNLVKDGLIFLNINNIVYVICTLGQYNKRISHVFTMMLYSNESIYNTLSLYISYVNDNKLNLINIKLNMTELHSYLTNQYTYIKAFASTYFNAEIFETCKMDEEKNKETYIIMKEEMINRLILLIKFYKYKQLKYFGIDTLCINDLYHYNFKSLVHIFGTTINKINNGLIKLLELCTVYNNFDKEIKATSITFTTNLNYKI